MTTSIQRPPRESGHTVLAAIARWRHWRACPVSLCYPPTVPQFTRQGCDRAALAGQDWRGGTQRPRDRG
eukprot:5807201-Pleurochrysis_carterae.AAC.1